MQKMQKLLLTGVALSAAVIAVAHRAAAQQHEWCTIESLNTRQCYWDTWDQCRQAKTHLEGGSCFRNPAFIGRQSADPGFRPVPNLSAPSPYVGGAVGQGRPPRVASRKKHRGTTLQ